MKREVAMAAAGLGYLIYPHDAAAQAWYPSWTPTERGVYIDTSCGSGCQPPSAGIVQALESAMGGNNSWSESGGQGAYALAGSQAWPLPVRLDPNQSIANPCEMPGDGSVLTCNPNFLNGQLGVAISDTSWICSSMSSTTA